MFRINPLHARYFLAFAIGLNVGTWGNYLVLRPIMKKQEEYNRTSDELKRQYIDRLVTVMGPHCPDEVLAEVLAEATFLDIAFHDLGKDLGNG